MGLFSKLFGKDAEKKANEFFGELLKATKEEKEKEKEQAAAEPKQEVAPTQSEPLQELGPAGRSWGELMPAEPNQYNFKGTYEEYFEQIFREDLPEYTVVKTKPEHYRATVYEFKKDGMTALFVELLHSSSAARKLREDCRKAGIPYLRYYVDYEGWWNTRSYVSERTRNAIRK